MDLTHSYTKQDLFDSVLNAVRSTGGPIRDLDLLSPVMSGLYAFRISLQNVHDEAECVPCLTGQENEAFLAAFEARMKDLAAVYGLAYVRREAALDGFAPLPQCRAVQAAHGLWMVEAPWQKQDLYARYGLVEQASYPTTLDKVLTRLRVSLQKFRTWLKEREYA